MRPAIGSPSKVPPSLSSPSSRFFFQQLLLGTLLVVFRWEIARAEQTETASILIGGRRELFVDDYLIEKNSGLELKLHSPTPREIVLDYTRDSPWDGTTSGYPTVFRDGDVIRMYYMAVNVISEDAKDIVPRPVVACYAESRDGIHWVRPVLGLIEYNGSKQNNIVWTGPNLDNFTPFKDSNPACPPTELYKAVAAGPGGLLALKSMDGLHWSYLSDKPIITQGKFDTQNNAFWDPRRGHYWCYIRDFHHGKQPVTERRRTSREGENSPQKSGDRVTTAAAGIRDIRVATSPDFRTWSEPKPIEFVDSPDEPLYTNQIRPYGRAPHLFLGFPSRYIERNFSESALRTLPDQKHRENRMSLSPRYGLAITDGLFMASRDGVTFRRWNEAFVRPGPERKDNWLYGDGFQGLGLIETPADDPTAPNELSLYVGEDHWKKPRLRRFTLRVDGFVSLHSSAKPGEIVSKPLIFEGNRLSLNFATSAVGSVLVELQDSNGTPIRGFALDDCDELFGDTLNRSVTWNDSGDVGRLANLPVRIRMVVNDGDVYSFQFTSDSAPSSPER